MPSPAFRNLFVPSFKTNVIFYRAMMYTNLSSISFHAAFILIFWWAGVLPLAYFNVLSVAMLTVSILFQRRGWVVASIILTTVELLGHAILAVYYTGWDTGFQQYLLALAIYAFLIPRQQVLSVCMVLVAFGCYSGLYYYSASASASYAGHESFLKYFFIPNTLIAICNAVYATSYYMNILDKAETALVQEHERSEGLLNNILPSAIATRLKKGKGTIADHFGEASVLFADIEGFTPFSQQHSPIELVNVLNDIFSLFDALVEKHDLEKIKTIGDAYMVASGVPVTKKDHAENLARFALEMLDTFDQYAGQQGLGLRLRIGINSGPVVAGVIGSLRFIYDMWGDCVNIASRMESQGIAGKIQISDLTHDLLRNSFHATERGTIEIKGKGTMRTWFLGPPFVH